MDKRKYWVFAGVFALSVVADQLTKVWARASLKGHPPIVVVSDWFDFRYSENPGVAFGMFRDVPYARYFLPLIALFALGVIISFVRRTRPDRLRLSAWLGLLAGGAVGNLIDRIFLARVTDFVVWKAPQDGKLCHAIGKVMEFFGSDLRYCEWPTFNVADAALVVGVVALLLDARSDDMDGTTAPGARPEETAK
jgi:signal peptidase II